MFQRASIVERQTLLIVLACSGFSILALLIVSSSTEDTLGNTAIAASSAKPPRSVMPQRSAMAPRSARPLTAQPNARFRATHGTASAEVSDQVRPRNAGTVAITTSIDASEIPRSRRAVEDRRGLDESREMPQFVTTPSATQDAEEQQVQHPYLRLHEQTSPPARRSEAAALKYLSLVEQATAVDAPSQEAIAVTDSSENPYWQLQEHLNSVQASEEELRAEQEERARAYLRHVEQSAFTIR